MSNNLDGTINPDFPEDLQPRDRTRLSSKLQVSKIASSLRPAQLTDSGMSSHGAPMSVLITWWNRVMPVYGDLACISARPGK
ncbi:hypothetical protein LJU47_22425 (plasmid) [Enterobacter hormaechei]|nr:hypothetical protein LJU47_22425 [Enterobacter hormaechei]